MVGAVSKCAVSTDVLASHLVSTVANPEKSGSRLSRCIGENRDKPMRDDRKTTLPFHHFLVGAVSNCAVSTDALASHLVGAVSNCVDLESTINLLGRVYDCFTHTDTHQFCWGWNRYRQLLLRTWGRGHQYRYRQIHFCSYHGSTKPSNRYQYPTLP